MTQKLIIGFLIFSIIGFNCSKLDETFEGDLTPDQVAGGGNSVSSLLTGTYNSMRTTFQDQTRVYCLLEMTTDELIGAKVYVPEFMIWSANEITWFISAAANVGAFRVSIEANTPLFK